MAGAPETRVVVPGHGRKGLRSREIAQRLFGVELVHDHVLPRLGTRMRAYVEGDRNVASHGNEPGHLRRFPRAPRVVPLVEIRLALGGDGRLHHEERRPRHRVTPGSRACARLTWVARGGCPAAHRRRTGAALPARSRLPARAGSCRWLPPAAATLPLAACGSDRRARPPPRGDRSTRLWSV